jgi:D-alanine-D-alanine ligase
LTEGSGKGISGESIARNPEETKRCLFLLERFHQPVIVETYLSGREFTVGITGTGSQATVIGVMEVLLTNKAESGAYSYTNKQEFRERCRYELTRGEMATACEKVALAAWNVLNCADGGRVDLRCDANGIPNFIEVNPLAGMNPTYSDLPILSRMNGISYDELIGRIMQSAIQKIK